MPGFVAIFAIARLIAVMILITVLIMVITPGASFAAMPMAATIDLFGLPAVMAFALFFGPGPPAISGRKEISACVLSDGRGQYHNVNTR